MDDNISIPVSIPLDVDGFLRRECPTCEQQFKWYSHPAGDPDAEQVDQYFCPLCGVASGLDTWWTPEQLDFVRGHAGPEIDRALRDHLVQAFRGIKGISYKPNADFSAGIETPDPLVEPDDMFVVEPPCHPNEPLKILDSEVRQVFCLICGSAFAI